MFTFICLIWFVWYRLEVSFDFYIAYIVHIAYMADIAYLVYRAYLAYQYYHVCLAVIAYLVDIV